MSEMGEDRAPLLPTLQHDRRLDAVVRESLQILRDNSEGRLRDRMDDVLRGGASLRELARDPEFTEFVDPLAEQGWQQWDAMDEAEQEALVEQSRVDLNPWRR